MKCLVRSAVMLLAASPGASYALEGRNSGVDLSTLGASRLLQEDNSTTTPETTDDFQMCVDKVGDTTYSHLFKPCNITIYGAPSEANLTFDDIKNGAEQENVEGLLETCSVLSDAYKLESLSYDAMFIWNDPCVGLEQRCYDLAALSGDQRKEVEDLISAALPSESDSLIGNATHVSVDCTADFQAKNDFEEVIDEIGKILGIGAVAFFICCSVLCCGCCILGVVLIFWCCARK